MHVTAVLVAFNRRELVAEALAGLAAQTRPVDRLIVVDNASTDGTTEVVTAALNTWGDRATLITLKENTGGAGGFAVGIAAALASGGQGAGGRGGDADPRDENFEPTDWVWVMDDDTIPSPTALAAALDTHERYVAGGRDDLAVMGSRVLWTDGYDHPMNSPKAKIGASKEERARAEGVEAMSIRSISFVSAFLRASRVRAVGLPIVDYFLWNDDFEFSARMLRGARGLFVPASVVTHKTKIRGSSDQDPGARFFFEVRNKLWLFRASRALKWWESLLYQAATAKRWVRTLRASSDREVLRDGLRRGWREGWGRKPRPNRVVLANAGVPADAMREIERLEQA